MGRTRKFDYTEALERGTRLFWKSGYESTSLRDLLDGMGIGESSFYNTLKSKQNAYLECLKHYNATVKARQGEALFSGPTAASGVRALFSTVLDCLDDPTTPSPICLMAASLSSEVLNDAVLREYVEGKMTGLAGLLVERFDRDREAGLLPEDFQPGLVVPVVLTYMQGLWRMALLSYERPVFERQIDVFLKGLGL
jgi:TetR/AcrR family transcriptional repressor of nem operon